jgi:hypothetical protein
MMISVLCPAKRTSLPLSLRKGSAIPQSLGILPDGTRPLSRFTTLLLTAPWQIATEYHVFIREVQ